MRSEYWPEWKGLRQYISYVDNKKNRIEPTYFDKAAKKSLEVFVVAIVLGSVVVSWVAWIAALLAAKQGK